MTQVGAGRVVAAITVLLAAGCGGSTNDQAHPASGRAARHDPVALPERTGSVGRPHIAGNVVREAPGGYDPTLGERIFAPLVGELSATAARSPDGRWLLYSAWRDAAGVDYRRLRRGDAVGEPALRLRDERTGQERT